MRSGAELGLVWKIHKLHLQKLRNDGHSCNLGTEKREMGCSVSKNGASDEYKRTDLQKFLERQLGAESHPKKLVPAILMGLKAIGSLSSTAV